MIKLTTTKNNKILQTAYNWNDSQIYDKTYSKFIYKFCRWYIRSKIDDLILKEGNLLIDLIVTNDSIDLGLYILDYYKILANLSVDHEFPITVIFSPQNYFTYFSNCNLFKNRRSYLDPSLKLLSKKEKKLFSQLYNLEDFLNVNNSVNIITNKD